MKKLFLLLVILGIFVNCDNPSSKIKQENKLKAKENFEKYGKVAILDLEERIHDFGEIDKKGVYEHDFKFTNTGNSPLIIFNVKASCGCTVPEYPKEPIKIGEQGIIKVKFMPNAIGVQSKGIEILSNSLNARDIINIKANVKNQ